VGTIKTSFSTLSLLPIKTMLEARASSSSFLLGAISRSGLPASDWQEKASRPDPPARVPSPHRRKHRRLDLAERALLSLRRRVQRLIPVILLGCIMTGWFTPTEAGVVAVAYILVVVIPALNPEHMRLVWRDFVEAGLIYSLPLITIAAASAFGWLLAYLRGPIVVAGWIGDMANGDPRAIMFLLVAVFTIVGDFIEPIPAIIIFMPVVNQLTDQASINSVHMGIVLIITLAFGLITPPYGLSLLMASKFVGVRFSSALRASLPIYVIFFVTIAFAIFFPQAVLWLPKALFPESVGCFKAPDGGRYICP
jgi:C4-dicarboxylate transporter, DctM subunit